MEGACDIALGVCSARPYRVVHTKRVKNVVRLWASQKRASGNKGVRRYDRQTLPVRHSQQAAEDNHLTATQIIG